MKRTFFIVIFAIVNGCQTAVVVESTPIGATVFAGERQVGKTPLNISSADITDAPKVADGYLVRVERDGSPRVWVLIPESTHDIQVHLKLDQFKIAAQSYVETLKDTRSTEPDPGPDEGLVLNRQTAMLLDVQTRALSGQDIDDKEIATIKQTFADSGFPYFIEGLTLYRAGKSGPAVDALREAVNHSPMEADYVSTYVSMKQQTGTK